MELAGIWIPFIGTVFGSAMVFLMKNKMNKKVEKILLVLHVNKYLMRLKSMLTFNQNLHVLLLISVKTLQKKK